MSDTNRTALLTLLVASYDDLKQRLDASCRICGRRRRSVAGYIPALEQRHRHWTVLDLHAYLFRVAIECRQQPACRGALPSHRLGNRCAVRTARRDAGAGPDHRGALGDRCAQTGDRRIAEPPPRHPDGDLRGRGATLRQIAERFGISVRTSSRSRSSRLWAHCAVRLGSPRHDHVRCGASSPGSLRSAGSRPSRAAAGERIRRALMAARRRNMMW